MEKLLFLIAGNAEQWRIQQAARAVLVKILLSLPVDEDSHHLLGLIESINPNAEIA
jgi:hypothetical protein